MKKIYLTIFTILLFISASAQTSLRGMYINDFDEILGNSVKEDSLLHYAQDSAFNYMALYDLHMFNLNNITTANTLASFIKRARENFSIEYVGAVCETYSGFQTRIAPFNNSRGDDHEKFNVFNLEFEFWTQSSVNPGGYYCTQYLQPNNCNCDTSGGFKFFIEQMHKIDSLAITQGAISETYLGWFNQGQASQIQHNVDRILLHAYRTNTSSLYSYSKTRLQYLASNNVPVEIAPIFSAEPAFMNTWLDGHSQLEAYNQYTNDFTADNPAWKQYIDLLGFQWFNYGFMPKQSSFTPTISASGPVTFCNGEDVTLTASSGDSYDWSNGQTTQSIVANASGNYVCDVTLNGQTRATEATIINVKSNPSVTITAGSFASGLTPLTANATAGSGSITSYQWLRNNVNVSGATSSTYSAAAAGNYTVEVTNSNGCVSTSPSQIVSATAIFEITASSTGIKAYPNPANNMVRIDFSSEIKSNGLVTFQDMNGRIIFKEDIIIAYGDNKTFVNSSDFSNGIYFLSIKSDDKMLVEKIIIEH